MSAVNEGVRVEEGEHGTIVVVGAWCETCETDTLPMREGECAFCGNKIVDLDTLSAKALRAQLDGKSRTPAAAALARNEVAPVIPIREITTAVATLQISEGFALPVDVAGEATAILAKRGAGKTNTARVLVEEYVRVGVQVAVLDPIGVWWGARSSGDGEHDGLPLPILGGEHGDVALPTYAGDQLARALLETGVSVILDLSDFSKDEQRTFVADFAERLYSQRRHDDGLIHIVLEEADVFAPQRARAGGDPEETSRMAGAVEQLARRGRSRGIGLTMITQRSSALSKDVLTQADLLIAMRTTGPTDIRSVREWVSQNADAGDEVVRSLPGLQTGEGWVWNPERELLARVHMRLAWTFDSSSTPKFGEARVAPARKAAVELPFQLLDFAEPERDVAADHRLPDADGRFGCKIGGCPNRSRHNAGPKAFLCPDHGGSPLEDDEITIRPIRPAPEPQPAARLPAPRPPAIAVEGEQIFGVTGHFNRDAQRVRDEAERLRQQADVLERIAEGLDELADMQ